MRIEPVYFLLLFFFMSCSTCGNDLKDRSHANEAIKKDASSMADALRERDYVEFMSYSPTIIIEGVGGKDAYLDYVKKMYDDFDEQGVKIHDIKFGEIEQLIRNNGEAQAVLSQELILKSNMKMDTIQSTLIAVKKRNSDRWLFMTANDRSWEDMKKIYPYLHEELHWD